MPRGCVMQTMLSYRRVDGDQLRLAAHYGPVGRQVSISTQPLTVAPLAAEPSLIGETIHIEDLMADADNRVSRSQQRCRSVLGSRTVLAAPLLRDAIVIGVFVLWRNRASIVLPISRSNW